jgi:hypothetical protein
MVAVLLTACGGGGGSAGSTSTSAGAGESSSSAKEAALREEVSSTEMFLAGEGGPFCEQFTEKARQKVLAEVAKSFGIKASCAQVMGHIAAAIGSAAQTLKHEIGELTVADVKVHGTSATVTLPASAAATLEESGGRWYITRGP